MHVAMATSSGNVPEGSLTSSDNSSARRTGSPLRTRFSINSRLVYFQSPSVAITMVPSHGDFVNGRATATPHAPDRDESGRDLRQRAVRDPGDLFWSPGNPAEVTANER